MNTHNGGVYYDVGLDTTRLRHDITSARGQFTELTHGVESDAARIEGSFRRIGIGIGSIFAVGQIEQFVDRIIKVRSEIQSLEASFETLAGSREKGLLLMQRLKDYAVSTPMQLNDLASGAQTLLGFNIELEKVMPVLKAIGDISMGNRDKFNSLTLAFAQMSATGKLMGQDLLQMINAGFNPLTEISAKTGRSISALKDEMSAGSISAQMVEDAFISATAAGGKFHGMLESQSRTMRGALSNLQGHFSDMLNDMGESTEGIISSGINAADTLVKHYETVGEVLITLAATYGTAKAALMAHAAMANAAAEAEIAALSRLVPAKAAEADADLRLRVAKGELTESRAAQIAALRGEIAAEGDRRAAALASARTDTAAAKESYRAALRRSLASKQAVRARQEELRVALQQPGVEAVAAAQKNLANAVDERSAAVKARKAAAQQLEIAKSRENAAATALETLNTEINTVGKQRQTRATLTLASAKAALGKASRALGLSMLANPYVLAAAAVASLAYVTYKLVTADEAATRAAKAHNDERERQAKIADERSQKVRSLVATIKDENTTATQKVMAFDSLTSIVPTLKEIYHTWQDMAAVDTSEIDKGVNAFADTQQEEVLRKRVADIKDAITEIEGLYRHLETAAKATIGFAPAYAGTLVAGQGVNWRAKQIASAHGVGGAWDAWWSGGDDNRAALRESLELAEGELRKFLAAKYEAETPVEVKLKVAQADYEAAKERLDTFASWTDALMAKTGKMRPGHLIDPAQADKDMAAAEKAITDRIESLRKEVANPLTFTAEKQKALASAEQLRSDMEGIKRQMAASGTLDWSLTLRVNTVMQSLKSAADSANSRMQNYVTRDGKDYTPPVQNKAYWENQKKEAQAALDALGDDKKGTAEWNKHEKLIKEADEKLEARNVSSKKSADKAANEAKRRAEQRQKLAEEALELARRNAADEIRLMEDGAEKKLRTLRQEHADRLAELDRQQREWAKANREAKTKGLGEDGLTDSQRTSLADARTVASRSLAKAEADIQRDRMKASMDAMRSYLAEYGTFEERQLAITQEYAEKIKEARKKGLEGEALRLGKERDARISSEEFRRIQDDIDWADVFGNIGGAASAYLRPTLDRLEKLMASPQFKSLPATDKKQYYDARSRLQTQVDTPSFAGIDWGELGRLTNEYRAAMRKATEANRRAADATENLEQAQKDYDKALSSGSATDKIAANVKLMAARVNKEKADSDKTDADNGAADAGNALNTATDNATRAVNNFASSLQNLGNGSLKGFADGVCGIFAAFSKDTEGTGDLISELGGKVGGLISAILQLLDSMGDDPEEFITGLLDKVFGVIERLLDQLFDGSLITGIVGNIWSNVSGLFLNILDNLTFGAFGLGDLLGGDSDPTLDDDRTRLEHSNELLRKSIDRLADKMDEASAAQAGDIADEQARMLASQIATTQSLGRRTADRSSRSQHSGTYHVNKAMEDNDWGVADALRHFGIRDAGGLWNLTPEQWRELAEKFPNALAEIRSQLAKGKDDASAYIDEMIAYAGQYEEILERMRQTQTRTSVDDIHSGFLDLMKDMEADSSAFAKNFEDMMKEAVFNSILNDSYREDMKRWYEDFAAAMSSDNELTSSEQRKLREQYMSLSQSIIDRRNEIMEAMGWDESTVQSATRRSLSGMSQDTGDAIEGRMTAIQIAVEAIRGQYEAFMQTIAGMTASSGRQKLILDDILYHCALMADYLKTISKNTGILASVEKRLSAIEKNTSGI